MTTIMVTCESSSALNAQAAGQHSRPRPASCLSVPVTVCTGVSNSRSSWAGRVRPPVTV